MIITWEKQQAIKPVSLNNKSKYEQLAKEVEEFELIALLGNTFYNEILSNYNTENDDKWKKLVEGCSFEDSCGNLITQKGLQCVLAYLVYAQYVMESYINDTFTGMAQKVRQDSEPISQGAMKNTRQHFREIAFSYFEDVRKYIIEEDFENYYIKKESKKNTFKIKGVSRI